MLILKSGDACVLNSINDDKTEAEIVTGESGLVPISLPIAELEQLYIGRYFLVKKQFRYDERSPEVLKTREALVLGYDLAIEKDLPRCTYRLDLNQPICRRCAYVYPLSV